MFGKCSASDPSCHGEVPEGEDGREERAEGRRGEVWNVDGAWDAEKADKLRRLGSRIRAYGMEVNYNEVFSL